MAGFNTIKYDFWIIWQWLPFLATLKVISEAETD